MKSLIAGCGYVGSALAKRLVNSGQEVFGLSRSGSNIAGVTSIKADLNEYDSLESIPEGLDTIYFLVSADAQDEQAYKAAYIRGFQTLLQMLRKRATSGALTKTRLVYVSSTGVYAQEAGEWVDEESPTEPESFTGQILLEAENVALNSGCNTSIVRFSGIYGPGRTWMIKQVASGQAACYFGAPQYSNRIHLDDCAGALQHIAALENPEEFYIVSDDEPSARTQFVYWLAAQLGAPEPKMQPLESASARMQRSNKRCSNKRLKESGYCLQVPNFREGYTPLVAEYLEK